MKLFNVSFFLILVFISFRCQTLDNRNLFSEKNYKKHILEWNKETRNYYVHAPKNKYLGGQNLPVIIMLHGRLGSGIQLMDQSGMNELADKGNFIAVYPDGLQRSWADGRGNTPSDQGRIDDVGFIEKMISELSSLYHINERKVFIAGHSNGGFMTQRMLLEKSNLFVGGVSVAAHLSKELVKKYVPENPVSVAFLIGTDDPFVPYYGGYVRDGGEILGAEDSFDRWKIWNECSASFTQVTKDSEKDETSIDTLTYDNCKNHSVVKLIRINGGGHSFPGKNQYIPFVKMGRPTMEIDGATEIVHFFKELGL